MKPHHDLSGTPVLYLDFDGVLHPDAVYLHKRHGLILRAEGSLMMHAAVLEAMLEPYPQARIVLSTSWVPSLGFRRTSRRLPPGLRSKVIGSTWHSSMKDDVVLWPYATMHINRFQEATRYQQIAWHVERHQVREWLAIDDLHSGYQTWPKELQHRLVMPHGERGLGCEIVQAELHQKLHNLFGFHTESSANGR